MQVVSNRNLAISPYKNRPTARAMRPVPP